MAQERNEHDAAYGVAVQSLKNELRIAVRLLRHVKEARETTAIEAHIVNSARSAFRHAAEALDRMPQLPPEDMQVVHRLMDDFRAALANLDQ
jgi:Holliday junction resolvasome RuvABC ATP-dependent DNA helicase subunit